MSNSKKPTHLVYTVIDTGKPVEGKTYTLKYWHQIGVAWLDDKGVMRSEHYANPVNGKTETRVMKDKPETPDSE